MGLGSSEGVLRNVGGDWYEGRGGAMSACVKLVRHSTHTYLMVRHTFLGEKLPRFSYVSDHLMSRIPFFGLS
jgi:hypothetical protein